jgi:DNA uptake protein ComE-like DNA-binding protein
LATCFLRDCCAGRRSNRFFAKVSHGQSRINSFGQESGLTDVNRASAEELDSLPGTGPVMAQKIIAGRPYRAKTDLVTRKVIPQSAYDRIKGQIVAH